MNGWYLVITQEMVEGLGLRGSELLVYALVNGYSQGGRGMYTGTLEHIGSVCGLSRRTAIRTLTSLVEKGLLDKIKHTTRGVTRVAYCVAGGADVLPDPSEDAEPEDGGESNAGGAEGCLEPSAKSGTGGANLRKNEKAECQSCTEKSAKIAPNNKRYNNHEKNKPSTNVECLSKKKAASSPAFDFRKGLVDLGITPETADAWIRVRRSKRAVNSEIALKGIAREIGKTGRPAEECARLAVEQSWQGFNAAWGLRYWAPPQRYSGGGAPRQAPRHEDYVRAAEEAKRMIREEEARRKERECQNIGRNGQNDRNYPVFSDILSH